jgi:hypothetical protein
MKETVAQGSRVCRDIVALAVVDSVVVAAALAAKVGQRDDQHEWATLVVLAAVFEKAAAVAIDSCLEMLPGGRVAGLRDSVSTSATLAALASPCRHIASHCRTALPLAAVFLTCLPLLDLVAGPWDLGSSGHRRSTMPAERRTARPAHEERNSLSPPVLLPQVC